jgi:hypothetical protein
MVDLEVEYGGRPELTADMIRAQLDSLVHDDAFRSSKRSVTFLKYVVEQTLNGAADQIKERTIGVEVFGRDPSYDTNLDHIVRTAAAAAVELRKRLGTYYVDEKHRSELRMWLLPGSYVPKFMLPGHAGNTTTEPGNGAALDLQLEQHGPHFQIGPVPVSEHVGPQKDALRRKSQGYLWVGFAAVAAIAAAAGFGWLRQATPQDLFWQPVLETPGSVLVVVGDHPNGPPTLPAFDINESPTTPVPSSDSSQTVPYSDTVTIARVVGELERRSMKVAIRRGGSVSFSDLRQGAVVLIGAFNNEWSLRLTRQLRYSPALDPEKHLIYIRDAKTPSSRNWSWGTNQPRDPAVGANSPKMQDFALISRIRDSETGHVVVVIGGLYTYGTEAAGEFLSDPELMKAVATQTRLNRSGQNLQIVLGTTVTDGIPGPPKVLAALAE